MIRYLDADFQVVREGDFCALCRHRQGHFGSPTSRYWSVDRQRPYGSAEAARGTLRLLSPRPRYGRDSRNRAKTQLLPGLETCFQAVVAKPDFTDGKGPEPLLSNTDDDELDT